MLGQALIRHKRAVLVLLLFSPTILFAVDYLPNYLISSNGAKHFSVVSADQGYSVSMAMDYPSYVATGQQVPVNITLRFNFSSPYSAMSVDDVKAELRYPSGINGTTNVVNEWQTLSSTTAQPAKNYTASGTFSRAIDVVATHPPSSSPFDVFVPATKFAINGISDITLYVTDANSNATTNHVSLSFLDSQTVYQTQLSSMRSTTALVVYQLLAALFVSMFYVRTRLTVTGSAEKTYFTQLESFRLQKNLVKLEELLKSGRIGKRWYADLKQKIDNELAQMKSNHGTT